MLFYKTNTEKTVSLIYGQKKILWINESFVNSKKCSLIQKNRFFYIKENLFESTKRSLIQRNFFLWIVSPCIKFSSILNT